MNKSQKIILGIALSVFFADLLFFAPMESITSHPQIMRYSRESFFKKSSERGMNERIDFDRLLLDILTIATLTGALLIIFSGKKKKPENQED